MSAARIRVALATRCHARVLHFVRTNEMPNSSGNTLRMPIRQV
jgi:hypothetical protein